MVVDGSRLDGIGFDDSGLRVYLHLVREVVLLASGVPKKKEQELRKSRSASRCSWISSHHSACNNASRSNSTPSIMVRLACCLRALERAVSSCVSRPPF